MRRSNVSILSPFQKTVLLTPSLTRFGRLDPGSCSLGHDPQLVTVGERRNIDRPVNRELSAQLHFHQDKVCITADAALMRLSISNSILPSAWERISSPTLVSLAFANSPKLIPVLDGLKCLAGAFETIMWHLGDMLKWGGMFHLVRLIKEKKVWIPIRHLI